MTGGKMTGQIPIGQKAKVALTITNLSKSFDGRQVLYGLNQRFSTGNIYCLMGASGAGKTTLLRILLGLEQPDCGTIDKTEGAFLSAVFQENRLCRAFSPMDNVLMVFPKVTRTLKEMVKEELCTLLPKESIYRPVSTLSGGMKRRVSVCRALAVPFDAVLMDEPFTGLDKETKRKVIDFIRQKAKGRLVVISTHQEEDVSLLGGQLIRLSPEGGTHEEETHEGEKHEETKGKTKGETGGETGGVSRENASGMAIQPYAKQDKDNV